MKNSQCRSDGRAYEEVVLAFRADADRWAGDCAATVAIKRFESVLGIERRTEDTNSRTIALAGSVYAQSEPPGNGKADAAGCFRAFLRSRLRFFDFDYRWRVAQRFEPALGSSVAAK